MLDDGEIERRVRLIRPMEAHNVPVKMMGETHLARRRSEYLRRSLDHGVAEVPICGQHDPCRHRPATCRSGSGCPNKIHARLSASDR